MKQVKVRVGLWRGFRKGETPLVPDDDLTRFGLQKGLVAEFDPDAVEDDVDEDAEPDGAEGPETPEADEPAVCGATKADGGVCHQPAGFGTDHVGEGHCRYHDKG